MRRPRRTPPKPLPSISVETNAVQDEQAFDAHRTHISATGMIAWCDCGWTGPPRSLTNGAKLMLQDEWEHRREHGLEDLRG